MAPELLLSIVNGSYIKFGNINIHLHIYSHSLGLTLRGLELDRFSINNSNHGQRLINSIVKNKLFGLFFGLCLHGVFLGFCCYHMHN